MMKTILTTLLAIFLIPNLAMANTCKISTGTGLLTDTDCDKVPDLYDNCPALSNPLQEDEDLNGVGNACDLSFAFIDTSTAEVKAGNAFNIVVRLENNLPVDAKNIALTARNDELGYLDTKHFHELPAGCTHDEKDEMILKLRTSCEQKPGTYPIQITAKYFVGEFPAYASTVIPVTITKGNCDGQIDEITEIDVYEIEDIETGKGAIYPIELYNDGDHAKSYILGVDGITGWGNWRIDPGTVLIVEPGKTRQAFLYVTANEFAEPGQRTFSLSVTSEGDTTRQMLKANVLAEEKEEKNLGRTLLIIVIILAIIGIIIALGKAREKEARY